MKAKLMLFAALMLAPMAFACVCPDYNVTFNSVTPVNGRYNWSYTVCHYRDNQIKYFMIETCICSNLNGYDGCIGHDGHYVVYQYGSNSSQPNMKVNYTYDSTTGITGLKFYDLSNFNGCKNFWFVTNENYDQINANASIKVKDYNLVCNYTIKSPKHKTIPAPEFPSAALPLLISVGAVSVAYKMRKTS